MNKFTLLGLISLVCGGVLVLFQAISSMMTAGTIHWKSLNLLGAVGADKFDWIARIPWQAAQHGLNYVVHMPLYLLLVAVGVLFLIIGGFFTK